MIHPAKLLNILRLTEKKKSISNINNFHQRRAYEGSGWTFHSILQRQLVISEMAPCERSPYFPLPKELSNPTKRLINIQNEDNECFRCCLVRYSKNLPKIRNTYTTFPKHPNFKGIEFVFIKNTMQK